MTVLRASPAVLVAVIAAGCGGGAKRNELPPSGPVSWAEAKQLILDCHVEGGEELHSRRLTLELDNGARVTTQEVGRDTFFRVLQRADPPCSGPKTFAQE